MFLRIVKNAESMREKSLEGYFSKVFIVFFLFYYSWE